MKKVKEIWSFKANVPGSSADGKAFLEAFANHSKLPHLTIGKTAFMGRWPIADKQGKVIGMIIDMKAADGSSLDSEAIGKIAAKATVDTYPATVESVENGRFLIGHIDYVVDDATEIDTRSEGERKTGVDALVEEAVAQGLRGKENAYRVVQYLRANKTPESAIERTVKWWFAQRKHADVVPYKTLYVDPELDTKTAAGKMSVVAKCVVWISNGNAVLLEGPKSVGKGALESTLCWIFNAIEHNITFSADDGIDVKDGVLSTDNSAREFMDTDEYRQLALRAMRGDNDAIVEKEKIETFVKGTSLKRIKSQIQIALENRDALVVDEINLAMPNLLTSIFNPLLDNNRHMMFPGNVDVKGDRPFFMVASMNPGYDGTNELNKSLSSRIRHLPMPYPKDIKGIIRNASEDELRLLGFNVKVPNDVIDQTSKFYKKVFDSSQKQLVTDGALAIRVIVSAIVSYMTDGGMLSDWFEDVLANGAPEDQPVLTSILNDTITI